MPKPETVADYIAGFPAPVATILKQLRSTILTAAPGATERISYGIIGFFLNGKQLIFLGGWKLHAGLYPIHPQEAALEQAIAPYRAKKDTVQLRYDRPIPHDLVTRLVVARAELLRAQS